MLPAGTRHPPAYRGTAEAKTERKARGANRWSRATAPARCGMAEARAQAMARRPLWFVDCTLKNDLQCELEAARLGNRAGYRAESRARNVRARHIEHGMVKSTVTVTFPSPKSEGI